MGIITWNIVLGGLHTNDYETLPVGKRIGAVINRSYVFVSNPIINFSDWYEQALILYIRSTVEGRIIAGGLDEANLEATSIGRI